MLLATCYLLLTTDCVLHTAYYAFLTVGYLPLPITHYLLLTAYSAQVSKSSQLEVELRLADTEQRLLAEQQRTAAGEVHAQANAERQVRLLDSLAESKTRLLRQEAAECSVQCAGCDVQCAVYCVLCSMLCAVCYVLCAARMAHRVEGGRR